MMLHVAILCLWGRKHDSRQNTLGSLAGVKKQRGDEKVEITLNLEVLKHQAGKTVVNTKRALVSSARMARQVGVTFMEEGNQAWNELRTSVTVQNDNCVVIAVKRSTIEFTGRTLLWTIMIVVFARLFLTLARQFKWHRDEGFNWPRTVRDRSLGEKEVVVNKERQLFQKAQRRTSQGFSHVDFVKVPCLEKEPSSSGVGAEVPTFRTKRESQIPPWWPDPEPAPTLPTEKYAQAQGETNSVLNDMLEKKMNGVDFELGNIIKLRELCRDFGTQISLDTARIRDVFYGTAIALVHDACMRNSELPSEGVDKFVAGLAGNIGLAAEEAAIIVISSVAAQTRASFLQTWDLFRRGEIVALHKELEGLVRVHSCTCPPENCPEMEIAARDLAHLSLEDRRSLLDMYIFAGGRNTDWIAKEGLNLVKHT
ncbi:uncharacterized protein [Physcomitrium patens]|uniref:Uncharacterized protein n=1 Tax=Physcomitrium patens TaxID=3218 RepID=A0A7I4ESI0_PHYPA|nr:uncharacterized protein LOC112286926 isoform X2 [Physcomitrium patens]XP_024385109.1 uncharacterized protein LOC112286926 isoform X2 [Physcomitrium patens]|eukprot:XP_024385108.1 uncharacterized protein LOC112286926 isoform X2 [Physcomitrella patens]